MSATLLEPVVADRTAATVARLREIAQGDAWGVLEWSNPAEPFIRPVGGRLAAYHHGALVLDLLVRCDDPRPGTTERFRTVSAALARGLSRLGVDARVGELAGEYCPGDWSVHAGGRHKLVGTGQRLVRDAFLFTAVVVVGDPQPLADAMAEAYDCMGLPLDPRTVGSVAQDVPGVTLSDVEDVLGAALAEVVPASGPDLVGTRVLTEAWDPR